MDVLLVSGLVGGIMFLAYSYKALSVDDFRIFNTAVKWCKERKKVLRCYPKDEQERNDIPKTIKKMSSRLKAYLIVNKVRAELFYTDMDGNNINLVIYRDSREVVPQTSPAVCMSAFSNTVKGDIPTCSAPGNFSASPILGYNPKYSGKRVEAWGYDINSAYASVILDDEWIDTSKKPEAKMIEEGEVGFDLNCNIKREGYSIWVFKKCPVPDSVKRYFRKHYQAKKIAGNMYKATKHKSYLLEKQKEKDMLNFPIGCLQNKNPWIRAWIVGKTNERIESLIDEDTLFWNTDSIVSKRRRYDIEENLGDELGQWKLEHSGVVAYIGNNYQWNTDIPTYRGVPKSWFPVGYDLLIHGAPPCGNVLEWDEDTWELRPVDEEDMIWQK